MHGECCSCSLQVNCFHACIPIYDSPENILCLNRILILCVWSYWKWVCNQVCLQQSERYFCTCCLCCGAWAGLIPSNHQNTFTGTFLCVGYSGMPIVTLTGSLTESTIVLQRTFFGCPWDHPAGYLILIWECFSHELVIKQQESTRKRAVLKLTHSSHQ